MLSPALPVSLPLAGMGTFVAVPAGSVNGTPLPGIRPPGAQALRIHLGANDAVQYTLIPATQGAPSTAPAVTMPPIAGPGVFDEFLTTDLTIYFLPGTTGSAVCRWM